MGYRSAGTRSKVVIGLLAAAVLLDGIAILSGLSQVSGVAGQVGLRLTLAAEGPQDLVLSTYSQIINDGVGVVSALVAMLVVRKVTRMQDQRHASIASAHPMPSASVPAAALSVEPA